MLELADHWRMPISQVEQMSYDDIDQHLAYWLIKQERRAKAANPPSTP